MKLAKLKLWNFRQFYGEQELEFSTDKDKHITLIHGENTVGKSTILNAVMWCLYGRCLPNYDLQEDLVNHHAKNSGRRTCEVTLEFIWEEQLYSARRVFNGDGNSTMKLHRIEDGNYRSIEREKALINQIVPEDMAEYFFFEGEGLGRLGTLGAQRDAREAIRTILGFRYAQTVIDDLGRSERKLITEIRKRNKDIGIDVEDANDLEGYQQAIIDLEDELPTLEQTAKTERKLYDKVVQEIKSSGYEEAEIAQRAIEKIESDSNRNNLDINSVLKERQQLIGNYGWAVFGSVLAEKTLNFIDESAVRGRIPANFTDRLVEDIIEDEECICGREVKLNTAAYDTIQSLRGTGSTNLIDERLAKARAQSEKSKGMFREFLERAKQTEERLSNLQEKQTEYKQLLAEQKVVLDSITQTDIQALNKNKESIYVRLSEVETKIRTNKGRKKAYGDEVDKLNRKIRQNKSRSKVVERMQRYEMFLQLLKRRCESRLAKFEADAIDDLQTSNSQILSEISRQDLRLVVEDDFSFRYIDENEQEIGKSDGERLLVNLVFVSCLINFARERVKSEDEFVIKGTIAPFLIDAPFGNLDVSYKARVASYLPGSTDQLIFLLSSSHWKGDVDDLIKDQIGKEYILINHQTMPEGSRPGDYLEIGSTSYKLSEYGAPVRCTKIEEIDREQT